VLIHNRNPVIFEYRDLNILNIQTNFHTAYIVELNSAI